MTPPRADRYLRRGGPVPQIYHGDLTGLTQALKDCLSASRFLPGVIFTLEAVRGKHRELIRCFQNGEDVTEDWEEDGGI